MNRSRARWLAVGLGSVIALGAAFAWLSRPLLRGPEGRYFDSAGLKIHYTDEGSGDPVILVHGFAVNGHLNWRLTGVVDELAPHFRVITIDARGHGRSDQPTDPAAYGTEMSDDIVRLMDQLGIERANVAGYSMGGFITLNLITRHPERILRASPCGFGWQRPDPSALNVYDVLGSAFPNGIGFAALASFLNPALRTGPFGAFFTDLAASALIDERAAGALARSLGKLAVTESSLRAIDVPVLAIVGAEDPLRAGVADLEGVLPHFEMLVIEGGTHRTTSADPRFRAALRRWFAGERAQPTVSRGSAAVRAGSVRSTTR